MGDIADFMLEDTDTLFNKNEQEELRMYLENYQADLVFRLKKRAEIRRQISTRKSVQEGKADRIADLLEEAAAVIELSSRSK